MMESFADADTWGQFGLVGLMAGALFVVIVLFMRVNDRKDARSERLISKLNSDNTTFIREVLQESQKERAETHERFTETNNKLSRSIDELTIAISKSDLTESQKKT